MASVHEIREVVIDKPTGEILDETYHVRTSNFKKQQEYYKMFVSDLALLHKTTHTAKKVLIELLMYEINKRGEIALGLHQKKAMAERIGFRKTSSIDQGIQNLIERDVLVRIARGIFMLNPKLFAKGDPATVELQNIRYCELRIIYSEKGREIKASIKEKDEAQSETNVA